ncbi:dihydroorotate dehydrogenase (quinone), partial [Microbacteriaceae bacterium K1510]|nr:dihydroorotate dehydrogenase (quinone) [Microbacteriaceae bacterium K1510]
IVGVNIGANKEAADRIADYALGIETFYDVASYFTINISSPNTPGLRDLQDPAMLRELLTRIFSVRAKQMAAGKPSRPIVVKLAPDIAEDSLGGILAELVAQNVDGIAIS